MGDAEGLVLLTMLMSTLPFYPFPEVRAGF